MQEKKKRLDEQRHFDKVLFSIMPQIKALIHKKFDDERRERLHVQNRLTNWLRMAVVARVFQNMNIKMAQLKEEQ